MTDQELIQLLKEDFASGYAQLVDTYIGLAYVIARNKLANVCGEEAIEEFVIDTFYDFSKQIEKIDLQKGSIKSYLSIIVKRKAIKKYHEQTRNNAVYSIDQEEISIDLASKENTEQSIEEKELRWRLINEIRALGMPDSEIMIRKYYYGQTAAEIGIQLNMNPRTVAKRSERALKKLRKSMEIVQLKEAFI